MRHVTYQPRNYHQRHHHYHHHHHHPRHCHLQNHHRMIIIVIIVIVVFNVVVVITTIIIVIIIMIIFVPIIIFVLSKSWSCPSDRLWNRPDSVHPMHFEIFFHVQSRTSIRSHVRRSVGRLVR